MLRKIVIRNAAIDSFHFFKKTLAEKRAASWPETDLIDQPSYSHPDDSMVDFTEQQAIETVSKAIESTFNRHA